MVSIGTSNFFLPSRNFNSIRDAKQLTSPPDFFINSTAADPVPPVASKSSIRTIFFA